MPRLSPYSVALLLCCGVVVGSVHVSGGAKVFHPVDFTRDGVLLPVHAEVLAVKTRIDRLGDTVATLQTSSSSSIAAIAAAEGEVSAILHDLSVRCTPVEEQLSVLDKESYATRERLRTLDEAQRMDTSADSDASEKSKEEAFAAMQAEVQPLAAQLESLEVKWAQHATTRHLCQQLRTMVGAYPQQVGALRGDAEAAAKIASSAEDEGEF